MRQLPQFPPCMTHPADQCKISIYIPYVMYIYFNLIYLQLHLTYFSSVLACHVGSPLKINTYFTMIYLIIYSQTAVGPLSKYMKRLQNWKLLPECLLLGQLTLTDSTHLTSDLIVGWSSANVHVLYTHTLNSCLCCFHTEWLRQLRQRQDVSNWSVWVGLKMFIILYIKEFATKM